MGHDDPMLHGQPSAGGRLPPSDDLHEELAMSDAPTADMGLARILRELPLPPGEVTAAREQVWARLLEDIARDNAPPPGTKFTPLIRTARKETYAYESPPAAAPAWQEGDSWDTAYRARRLLLIVAMLLVFVVTGVGVSLASASALPSSPLYGVKRAEEWLELHTAWSDQRRGDALLAIASHRLAEAEAESEAGNGDSVHSLVQELDGTVTEAIDLAASMISKHEDATAITAGLERVLNDENTVQSQAQQQGHQALATTLGELHGRQLAAIQSHHLNLPHSTPGNHAGGNGNGPHATQTPGGSGECNGKGSGSGNGTCNGNGNSNAVGKYRRF
jgi:hypothetical protein